MTTPFTAKERVWNDPPLEPTKGKENLVTVIGAIVYPTITLIAVGIAHFVFNQPIILDGIGFGLLLMSPVVGALVFRLSYLNMQFIKKGM